MKIKMKEHQWSDGYVFLMSTRGRKTIVVYQYDPISRKKKVWMRIPKSEAAQEVGDAHHNDWAVRKLLEACESRLPFVDGRCYNGQYAYDLEKVGQIRPSEYVLVARMR